MVKRGFDTQKLTTGLTLCKTAEDRWDGRQNAMGAQLADEARKAYADFRETARTEFTEDASLAALSLSKDVPDDMQVLLTEARGAYTTALKAVYQAKLVAVGYGPAELQAELDALKALSNADEAQARLAGDAQQATEDLNTAVQPVRAYRTNLLKIARRVFRKEPAQLRKLDF